MARKLVTEPTQVQLAARWEWCASHPNVCLEMLKLFVDKNNGMLRFGGWIDGQIEKEKTSKPEGGRKAVDKNERGDDKE